jgi:hypothetical protein
MPKMPNIGKILETFFQKQMRSPAIEKEKQLCDHILLRSFIKNLVFILKFILKYFLRHNHYDLTFYYNENTLWFDTDLRFILQQKVMS